MHIVVDSFADSYSVLRKHMCMGAISSAPRGMEIKELMNVMVTIKNPRNRLAYHKDRAYNLPFNIAELVAIITGENSVEFVSYFNKNVAQFSDDGETFYGAYGPRVLGQISGLLDKLTKEDSRQAVINIYDGSKDLYQETKDVPCTIALQFMIRENKLNLTTFMRSNDLFWGYQYDVFNFTMIQEWIYNELKSLDKFKDLELGTYTHFATSLHVYERHFKLLESMHSMEAIEMPSIKTSLFIYNTLKDSIDTMISGTYKTCDHEHYTECLLSVLEIYYAYKANENTALVNTWASKFLKKYQKNSVQS